MFSVSLEYPVSNTDLAAALNDLPTLYPNGVSVAMRDGTDVSQPDNGFYYIVTFTDDRGKCEIFMDKYLFFKLLKLLFIIKR